MLVVSRNEGEAVFIGENIRVVLLKSTDGRSRIGIDAPRNIPVYRDEVHVRRLAEQAERRKRLLGEDSDE